MVRSSCGLFAVHRTGPANTIPDGQLIFWGSRCMFRWWCFLSWCHHYSILSYTVPSRPFSKVLRGSRDIPVCSLPYLYILCLLPSVPSISVVVSIILLIVLSRVFHLIPSISLFRIISFQFSILGSNRSEFGSPSDSFTFLFQPQFRSPLFPICYSYDFCYSFELWSVFLLFGPVYKSSKLCSYSLACNQIKSSAF